jgi:hypothetical protein
MATLRRLVIAFHGFVMGSTHVVGATSIRAHAACTARSIDARKSQHPYDCRTGSALIASTIEASHDTQVTTRGRVLPTHGSGAAWDESDGPRT